ncbi:hypothetical protein C8R43DRAFT_962330 [Mycena crocata]|nr:hypothetical protein C8R43DRAFT_962330 [Mycena crocata]
MDVKHAESRKRICSRETKGGQKYQVPLLLGRWESIPGFPFDRLAKIQQQRACTTHHVRDIYTGLQWNEWAISDGVALPVKREQCWPVQNRSTKKRSYTWSKKKEAKKRNGVRTFGCRESNPGIPLEFTRLLDSSWSWLGKQMNVNVKHAERKTKDGQKYRVPLLLGCWESNPGFPLDGFAERKREKKHWRMTPSERWESNPALPLQRTERLKSSGRAPRTTSEISALFNEPI